MSAYRERERVVKPQQPSKAGARPEVPVAIKCRCGKRIVLEPRWIGKPTACAGCEADFVVSMVYDPKARRWMPHIRYTPTVLPDRVVKKGRDGYAWANVTCVCGSKIGLEARFFGRTMVCSACAREFIVRLMPRRDRSGDTAVVEFPAAGPAAAADRARTAPAEADPAVPPIPSEMHLLCTCGEELAVPSLFYNRNMYCAGCGVLMHLRLMLNQKSRKYELLVKLLKGDREEES